MTGLRWRQEDFSFSWPGCGQRNLPSSWDRVCFSRNCCSLICRIWILPSTLGTVRCNNFLRFSPQQFQSCTDIEHFTMAFSRSFSRSRTSDGSWERRLSCRPPPASYKLKSLAFTLQWMDWELDFVRAGEIKKLPFLQPVSQSIYSVRRSRLKFYSPLPMCFLSDPLHF